MVHRDKASVTGAINLLDCETCRQRNPKEQRRMFGCGFETQKTGAKPWAPSGYLELTDGKRPAVCIGYTRRIPVVQETAWDLVHAEEWHCLSMLYPEVTEEQWERMRVLKLGRSQSRDWALANPEKKP